MYCCSICSPDQACDIALLALRPQAINSAEKPVSEASQSLVQSHQQAAPRQGVSYGSHSKTFAQQWIL